MGTRPPSGIAEERDRLRAENAALRDLLAAVQETASTGEQAHGEGEQYYYAGHFAAMRISIWLEDVSGQDARKLARTASMFREHAAEITARVKPRSAKDDAPSVASDEAAAVLAASIASGQPVTVTDDEPPPDCGGCGHAEMMHERPAADPMAAGQCYRANCGCAAYALPDDGEPGDPDPHAARASLRIAGGAA